jgi:hypothetical protein
MRAARMVHVRCMAAATTKHVRSIVFFRMAAGATLALLEECLRGHEHYKPAITYGYTQALHAEQGSACKMQGSGYFCSQSICRATVTSSTCNFMCDKQATHSTSSCSAQPWGLIHVCMLEFTTSCSYPAIIPYCWPMREMATFTDFSRVC